MITSSLESSAVLKAGSCSIRENLRENKNEVKGGGFIFVLFLLDPHPVPHHSLGGANFLLHVVGVEFLGILYFLAFFYPTGKVGLGYIKPGTVLMNE